MKTEQIERYLTRQMTDEERSAFEQEMREHPQLAEDVKIVAWTIEAIRERGKQEDEEVIKRMREEMGSDNKRYYATVAAVIGGVLIVAAMTAVSIPPLYQHVIKPIIESVFPSEEKSEISNPQQPSSLNAPSLDSIASSSDTDSINNVGDDTQGEDQKVANEPQKQEDEPAIEENVKEEPLKEEKAKEDVVKPKEESKVTDKKEPKVDEPKLVQKEANLNIRKRVGNTEYHLLKIDYDNKGNLVAYMTLQNNHENIEYVFDKMPYVNIDGDQNNAYRVVVNGETTNTFTLKKRQPVNLVIYFSGVKKNAEKITLLYVKNGNETKSCQMTQIPIN